MRRKDVLGLALSADQRTVIPKRGVVGNACIELLQDGIEETLV